MSDDHEHEDDCDIQALAEFTKIQEQIINMYTTLSEEKKNLRGEDEDDNEANLNDNEEKVKVRTKCRIIEVLIISNRVLP